MLRFKYIAKLLITNGLISLVFLSCEEALFEPKLSEESVVLLSPFEWFKKEGASRYQVQLASPNFENPDFIVFNRFTDTIFIIDTLKQIGSYEWRVRGVSNTETTPYTTSKIELINPPGFEFQTVNLTSPEDNKASNTLNNTLSWELLTEAEAFEIQILDSNSEVIITESTKENSIMLTFPEGTSTWQVKGLKAGKNTSFSKHTIIIDSTQPETPNLTTPADASTIAKADLEFEWTRTPIEGTKEIDSIFVFTDAAQTALALKQKAVSPLKLNLENGTYYWKIQAFDEAGNESEESTVFSVIVN